jgi:hypothetical protein
MKFCQNTFITFEDEPFGQKVRHGLTLCALIWWIFFGGGGGAKDTKNSFIGEPVTTLCGGLYLCGVIRFEFGACQPSDRVAASCTRVWDPLSHVTISRPSGVLVRLWGRTVLRTVSGGGLCDRRDSLDTLSFFRCFRTSGLFLLPKWGWTDVYVKCDR